MARAPVGIAPDLTKAIGVNGLRASFQSVWEEPEPKLRGYEGRRTLERMARAPVLAAALHALDSVVRSVRWEMEPYLEPGADTATQEALDEARWVERMLFEQGQVPWPDFISEALTFTVQGFSLFEIIWERREDGRLGVRDIQPRAQETIYEWRWEEGAAVAAVQKDPVTGITYTIPLAKCVHFILKPRKRNPEGMSLIRAAYKPWKRMERLEAIEDIGVERDLTGVPVLYLPSAALADDKVKDAYAKLVRDVRFNEQAGVLLPSDPFTDGKGGVGGRAYELTLLSSNNTRSVTLGPTFDRCEAQMARLLLADFLLLGRGAGSFALSKDKTDLFSKSLGVLGNVIEAGVNKLIGQVWELNGLPGETRPRIKAGPVAPEDLAGLASFLGSLASAGATVFPDEKLENALRQKAGLPPATASSERDTLEGDQPFGGDGDAGV